MTKKEKVPLIRPDEFQQVEEELNSALLQLDEANDRILQLLSASPAQEQGLFPAEELETGTAPSEPGVAPDTAEGG